MSGAVARRGADINKTSSQGSVATISLLFECPSNTH